MSDIDFENYEILEKLNFNDLYSTCLVKYKNNGKYAIVKKKMIKKKWIKDYNLFYNNLNIIKELNHENLLKLFYYNIKEIDNFYEVFFHYEYSNNGLLIYYLNNIKDSCYKVDLFIVKQLFKGILYLINNNPFYIYYNNLYFDQEFKLKISNWGVLNSWELIDYQIQSKYKNNYNLLMLHQFVHLSIMILTKKDNIFNIRENKDFALQLIKHNKIERLKNIFSKEKNLKIVDNDILDIFIKIHLTNDFNIIIDDVKIIINNIEDIESHIYFNYFEKFFKNQNNEIFLNSNFSLENNVSSADIIPKIRNNIFFEYSIKYKIICYEISLLSKYLYLKIGNNLNTSNKIINIWLKTLNNEETINEYSEFMVITRSLKFILQPVSDINSYYIIFKLVQGENKEFIKIINNIKTEFILA